MLASFDSRLTASFGCRWSAPCNPASGKAVILCPVVYPLVENGSIVWARILPCTALGPLTAHLSTSCRLLRKVQLASAIIPFEMQLPQSQMRAPSNFGEHEKCSVHVSCPDHACAGGHGSQRLSVLLFLGVAKTKLHRKSFCAEGPKTCGKAVDVDYADILSSCYKAERESTLKQGLQCEPCNHSDSWA